MRSQRARCQTTTRRASGPRFPRWRASTGFQRPPRTETCSHSALPLPALAAVAVHARQSCIHVPSRPNRRASPLKPHPPAPSGSRTPMPRTPSPAAAARVSTTPRCARRAASALPPRRAAPRRAAAPRRRPRPPSPQVRYLFQHAPGFGKPSSAAELQPGEEVWVEPRSAPLPPPSSTALPRRARWQLRRRAGPRA